MVRYETLIKVIEEELVKCEETHTYITRRIKEAYNRFKDKYSDNEFEHLCLYDSDGNEIIHLTDDSRVTCSSGFKQMCEMGYKDMYSIHNHPSWLKPFADKTFLPTHLSEADFRILGFIDYENKEQPFIFRTQTACSDNGSMMSIIRGDDFKESDIIEYDKISRNCVQHCRDYKDLYADVLERKVKDIVGDSVYDGDDYALYSQAHKQTVKEIGGMKAYLKNKGVFDDFKKVNCRLVMQEP